MDQAGDRPLAALDAVALVESGLGALCDITVAVTAPLEARIRRLIQREGISEDYARLRIAAQKPDGAFSALCGYTLYNDCPDTGTFAAKCDQFLNKILEDDTHD